MRLKCILLSGISHQDWTANNMIGIIDLFKIDDQRKSQDSTRIDYPSNNRKQIT